MSDPDEIQKFQREMRRLGYLPMSNEAADEYVRECASHHRPQVYVKVSDFGAGHFRKPFRRRDRGWCVQLSGTARLIAPMVKEYDGGFRDVVFFGDYSS